jgi:hypothetical protein
LENGQLSFNQVSNSSSQWISYTANANIPKSFSHISISFQLNTAPDQNAGWLVLASSCRANWYMNAHIGGPQGKLVVEYAPNDGSSPEIQVDFESLFDGKPHKLDLRWEGGKTLVAIDNVFQARTIPCEGPGRYVNIGVGLNADTQVSGSFDDIFVWQ